MLDVSIHLRDRSALMVASWQAAFSGASNVEISHGDIFDAPPADAIVSPANSFGYMTGGIDGAYSAYFGDDLSTRLRTVLRAGWDGELPVGNAIVLETGHARIPYLISAPTMRVPGDVSQTVNAYLAFRAALIAIRETNRRRPGTIRSVLCPGMCTFHGRMSPERAARQMRFAHQVIAENDPTLLADPAKVLASHQAMLEEE